MKQNNRVLIIDEMHESILPLLKEEGYEPVYLPVITREGIIDIIKEFSGLIVRSKTDINREIIDAAPDLKFVARAGAGMDKLDVQLLSKSNIKILNSKHFQFSYLRHKTRMLNNYNDDLILVENVASNRSDKTIPVCRSSQLFSFRTMDGQYF